MAGEESSLQEMADEESTLEEMAHVESSLEEMADDEHSLEQMEIEARLEDQKMCSDILRSIWLYFGVPSEYTEKIRVLNDEPFDKEFTHFISKAVVVDILRNRDVNGLTFEIIFHSCTNLDKDVLKELDIVILAVIENIDYFSAFIKFCAILSDFILFLRCKGNFLNLGRQRLINYWCDYYAVYFEKQIMDQGGLEALKNAARTKARIYPHPALQKFTSNYCSPDSDYNKENIPAYFKQTVHERYKSFNYNFY